MRNTLDPRPEAVSPDAASPFALSEAGADLCRTCGLCCNGVLFGSVVLQEHDHRAVLSQHRFDLRPQASGWGFLQPCRACRGQDCAIYPDRPQQCRDFHCRLLHRLARGQTDRIAALRMIQDTRRMAAQVEALLVRLGNTETALPLSQRFQRCLAEIGEESSERLETRAELLLAVQALTSRLRDQFYLDP